MKLGATFPQTEIGPDPADVKAYAQAVEAMGFDYLLAYDHVLGADVGARPDWRPLRGGPPAYTHVDQFHEPFVLFGYLAGVTERIGLATGVLVLSQRQAALVAKQAAEVDVLSGGRLRLGIGIGWNDVEHEALGMDFRNRGARSEEQVELLKALWTRPVVDFDGRWHKVTAAGINPLPVQRPIPIWFGGRADAVLDRIGRVGDGWFANMGPEEVTAGMERVKESARRAGRDPEAIGVEVGVHLGSQTPEDRAQRAEEWRDAGVTHLTFNTMIAGLEGVDAHIDALSRFKAAFTA